MPKVNTDELEIEQDQKRDPVDGAADPQEDVDEAQTDAGAGDGAEGGEGDGKPAAGAEAGEEGDADEVVVTIGDEPAAEEEHRAPEWVRDLRKSNREKDKQLRERDAEIARLKGAGTQPAPLGAKPSLEACEFDTDRYERELEGWHARKRDTETQAAEKQRAADAATAAWQAKLGDYNKGKVALKVSDFEEAEDVARDLFDVSQQGIIISGADSPAMLIYALGKNPKKAAELAGIKDPVKFAFAMAKTETQLKTIPRKTVPPPEKVLRSSGKPGISVVDNTLEKLREEAAKSGDMTKLLAYKNSQREKARAA